MSLSYFFRHLRVAFCLVSAVLFVTGEEPQAQGYGRPVHGLAMHGAPFYGPDFTHFQYVNPNAPRGGTLRMAGNDTFDSFNPYISKGVSAAGLGLLSVTLLEKSQDEAFSMYGALAQTVELAQDRSSVIFTLRPEAKWSDGQPITADDVVWSFYTLFEKGRPLYKAYYSDVASVTALSARRVKFVFSSVKNAELPLIVGQLAIVPKHYWEGRDFTATTLEPPVSGGPYTLASFDQGRTVRYARVKDWWGDDVPVYRGRYNFDQIVYEYYRDQDVAFQAFLAGDFDYRQEYTAKLWATGYDVPPVQRGEIIKRKIANALPQGMQGFALNVRKPLFQDIAVRKALNYAFDFEWSNTKFAYGAYTRSRSYFSNSEMEATGLPSAAERAVLEPFRDQLPAAVFDEPFVLPQTDGSGRARQNLRIAALLLDEAGYVLGRDGVRVHSETGVRLSFEFLVASTNAAFERWFAPYKKALRRVGIDATLRIVDAPYYISRVKDFDFDMIVHSWGQSLTPGNEQREYWGSAEADMKGARNYIGLKDPVVDALIAQVIAAPTREDLIVRSRALDRVLQHGWYVVPNWHIPAWRIAYWDKFGQPEKQAPYDVGVIDTWWSRPVQASEGNLR